MSIGTHRDAPCWQINEAESGQPPEYDSGDGWAHYATREEAEADRSERQADNDRDRREANKYAVEMGWPEREPRSLLVVAQSFDRPCVKVICDKCGDALDASGEGWTHFDPNDSPPMVADWSDMEWTERGDKHYHDECALPWCEQCETEGHDADDCDAAPVAADLVAGSHGKAPE